MKTFLSLVALAATLTFAAATPNCKSLGVGPLGYNTTGIGIYQTAPANTWLAFQGVRGSDGRQILQPTKDKYTNENFEYFACQQNTQAIQKSETSVWQGYIASVKAPGYCLTASALHNTNAKFVSKPCVFTSPTSISDAQNFQFSQNTFFDYYVADFLGETRGIYPPGATQDNFPFQKSGNKYHYTPQSDSLGPYIRVKYLETGTQSGQHDLLFYTSYNASQCSCYQCSPDYATKCAY